MSPAAVKPSVTVPFVALNEEERIGIYRSAFLKWIKISMKHGFKLCVIETTGASAALLFGDLEEEVEFLSHQPPNQLEALGKGALESHTLDYAMKHLGEKYGDNISVHKVTGKLWVRNWERILKVETSPGITIRRSMDRGTCDTRVFTTTPYSWLKYFRGAYYETDDSNGRFLEHVIGQRSVLAEYSPEEFSVRQFATPPKIVGVSGSDGKPYGGFSKDGLSNALSQVEKFLLPPFRKRMI